MLIKIHMASTPRSYILEDNSIFHVTWQCHNQEWLMEEDWVKKLYYNLLLKYKDRYGVEIYSYCFMDNHPHISGKLKSLRDFSDFWRVVNSCFAKKYNKAKKRKGQVVMDRFKSPQIHTDRDLLKVMLYIDMNPKRAHKVNHPRENQWSSYGYYAYGKEDPLISPAPSYLLLGSNARERQKNYRELVVEILKNDWKEKKPYSSEKFIGNSDWVIMRGRELRDRSRGDYKSWINRYRERFGVFLKKAG